MGAGDPCDSPALSWTPGCQIADIIDPPSEPSGPPPDTRPTCDSFKTSGLSDLQLRSFNTQPECQGANTLSSWLEQERTKYCNELGNFMKDPGGSAGTCEERNRGLELAKTYCSQGNNIKTTVACTREYLGDDVYVELARTYCRGPGKMEQWCSCYNVMNNVCNSDPNAAGCAEKASTYDVLVEKTPEAFRTNWSGREPCYGLVCQESGEGSKYIPTNANQNCSKPINICGQSIAAEGITASTIDARCYLNTGDPVDSSGHPDYPTSDPTQDPTRSTQQQKIGGIAASIFSFLSSMSVILVILLILSNDSGPRRFKR